MLVEFVYVMDLYFSYQLGLSMAWDTRNISCLDLEPYFYNHAVIRLNQRGVNMDYATEGIFE